MINFFSQFLEITAVMSEKEDGSMKILLEDETIWKQNKINRQKVFRKIGIDGDLVVSANLAHGNNVEIIENAERKIVLHTDGLVTNKKNIILAITVADCVPVFFYEKENKIIALAHAGWRGITGHILPNIFRKITELGGNPKDLYLALGPGINECHFEIQEDVIEKFKDYHDFIIKRDGKIFVDLKGIIKEQLLGLGISMKNIEDNTSCVYESENLFSFRRDKPKITETMIAMIGMK